MIQLTFANLHLVRAGDRIVVDGDIVRKVRYDLNRDEYLCDGMSLPYILESYDKVEWLKV